MNYTVEYGFDSIMQCGKIKFNNNTALMDFEDLFSIINNKKTFTQYTSDKQFPYYMRNEQQISYLEHIFKYLPNNIIYTFKNGNTYDLRRSNVEIFHKYHEIVKQKYNVISYQQGHITTNGRNAFTMRNPIWTIDENGIEYLLMYCGDDNSNHTLAKLCSKSYQKIVDWENNKRKGNKICFSINNYGYVQSSATANKDDGSVVRLTMHQIIMDFYGHGGGLQNGSIDHINQNRTDNTFNNLRIATMYEQHRNSNGIKEGTKRARKVDALEYPEGITHDMIPKYISYRGLDKYGTSGKNRSYFVVEKHPTLIANNKKALYSSKSEKVSPEEKLQQAIDILSYLDKGEMPPNDEPVLPKYYSLINSRGKPHLVYERRTEDGVRQNVKMVLPEEYVLAEQLERIQAKVVAKYGE